ncbi:heat shock transcription factor, Y-linked-like [Cyrtonyx montezumae]|uniref:heat shock transcription factor, Y-linked-like n=1 Tax=Cyrtonyx montezumae TaxID=9017 RepID=UPI0032DB9C66
MDKSSELKVSASPTAERRGKRAARGAALGQIQGENTSQKSKKEPTAKTRRLNLPKNGSSNIRGSVSSASFLRKLREIVDSDRFQSIWWSDDGNIIVIEENLFRTEVLGTTGPLSAFDIGSMITFIRWLHLHKFFITEADLPTSASRARFPAAGAMPASGELLCYYNPYFQRDYPHMPRKFKRSAGVRRRAPAAFPAEPTGPSPAWQGPDSGAGGDGVGRQHNLCYRRYR